VKKYKKRSYLADCLQLTLDNQAEVVALLGEGANAYGLNCILFRDDIGIQTIRIGDFVVRGENGVIKSYASASFHAKYQAIDVPEQE